MLWKGDDAGLLAIHVHIKRELLKTIPLRCTKCGETKGVEVASINGHNYTRNINDYTFLCKKCHTKLDCPNVPERKTLPNGDETKTRVYSTGKKWPVGAKKYAISAPSEAVALAYGKTVSRGILEMESRIVKLEQRLEEYRANIGGRIGRDCEVPRCPLA